MPFFRTKAMPVSLNRTFFRPLLMTQTASESLTPVGRLDPEDAQLALATVQEVLHRHKLVENLVHRQEQNDSRSELVEGLLHRQHEA